jgi:hypothetical protein
MDKREKVARRLHYFDWFYRQLPITSDWDELAQGVRNQYLNFAAQVIKIVEED